MSTSEPTPIISHTCPDGTLIETIYDPDVGTTALAVGRPNGAIDVAAHYDLPDSGRLAPYSPQNNLLTTGCVLLPSAVGEVLSTGDLVDEMRAYLARYVDLSPAFTDIAPFYALLSWVYDAFNELPYLRFAGDFGTGKTRALLTIGSICYKPFFASGASTVSPIFHILDSFRSTLILDEADHRYSDMTADLTKILNQGTVNGLPVLRTMTNRHRELNPQAFRVYGPKIIGMRESFADKALESRFLTEPTGHRPLPPHIPIHTPATLAIEARELRNKLLAWRFANRWAVSPDPSRKLPGVEPRLNQTALALLSLVDDEAVRSRIADHLLGARNDVQAERRRSVEGTVLAAIVEAFASTQKSFISISEIAQLFHRKTPERFYHPVTNKWLGSVIRTQLRIPTMKSHGVYVISQSERPRIEALADRFGIAHSHAAGVAPLSTVESASLADLHASSEMP
jgi:hypothetical protein